jgi:ABC-type sulfate transport system permease component
MIELGEDEEKFERFMVPLAGKLLASHQCIILCYQFVSLSFVIYHIVDTFERIASQLASVGSPVFPEEELKVVTCV